MLTAFTISRVAHVLVETIGEARFVKYMSLLHVVIALLGITGGDTLLPGIIK